MKKLFIAAAVVSICLLGWNAYSDDADIRECGDDYLGVGFDVICPAVAIPTVGYNTGGQLIMGPGGEPRIYGNPCYACNSPGVAYYGPGWRYL